MQRNKISISAVFFVIGILLLVGSYLATPHAAVIFELPKDKAALLAYQSTDTWLDVFSLVGLTLTVTGYILSFRGFAKYKV